MRNQKWSLFGRNDATWKFNVFPSIFRTERYFSVFLSSRVIFGPPVTTESRGRFESGFGYFEVLKKNRAPMPLAKVWAKPRRGQNSKWPPAAILDLLKSAILRRFYSNNTIEVSFLTNSEARNPFQGLFFKFWPFSPWNPRWPPAAILDFGLS